MHGLCFPSMAKEGFYIRNKDFNCVVCQVLCNISTTYIAHNVHYISNLILISNNITCSSQHFLFYVSFLLKKNCGKICVGFAAWICRRQNFFCECLLVMQVGIIFWQLSNCRIWQILWSRELSRKLLWTK